MDVKIEALFDHMIFSEQIARWIYAEFIKNIKPGYSFDDILKTVRSSHTDRLPIRLIAVIKGKCIGTISLVENDLKSKNYTPWLAALYVDVPYRNLGVGEKLIVAVKATACQQGYSTLFLRTEHAGDYYRNLGWQFVETCSDDNNLNPDVFKYNLKAGYQNSHAQPVRP